ncbi:hypothetical protein CBFG_05487 [Clostridiales bacterium 1_7_47FAA]|nr:hypothetical protein CBFG_05487 [Clostridiales bacterium 1_7_47FAA]
MVAGGPKQALGLYHEWGTPYHVDEICGYGKMSGKNGCAKEQYGIHFSLAFNLC